MNLRLAFRTLLKTPYVTAVGVLSLALGIGATTAIFSLYYQVLMRPLPVKQPGELVNLRSPGFKPGNESCGFAGGCEAVFSYPMFRDLERQQTPFTGIAGHVSFGGNLTANGTTMAGRGMMVSGSYFPLLGLQPVLGRLLGPEDERAPGNSPVVVLSHDYWRTRFAENPAILDQAITVNGHAFTIVGVAPPGFTGTTLQVKAQVFVPITMRELLEPGVQVFTRRRNHWIYLFARLKTGVSMEAARSSINGPFHQIITEVEAPTLGDGNPNLARFTARQIELEDGSRGQSELRQNASAPLSLLFAVTGLVLLVACANLANLFLARASNRAGEMAIRASVGANRRQLVAQLLTEACLLSALGGLGALAVARWTVNLILGIAPEAADVVEPGFATPVLLFIGAVTLAVGVAFGLIPALQTTRSEFLSVLKARGGHSSGGRSMSRFRSALAAFQIALSLMLLISAGLFLRSLLNLSRVELGINAENVVVFGVSPGLNGYTAVQSRALFERLEEELGALPGVTGVGGARVAILIGDNWGNDVSPEGFDAGPEADQNSNYNLIGPNYFSTLGIRMKAGRDFTRSDTAGQPKVAIVNEEFARKFNLGSNPVGKRLKAGRGNGPFDIEIVGLVEDSKYGSVKQKIPPVYFQPYRQNDGIGSLNFYVRSALGAARTGSAVSSLVARLDPNLPVENPVAMIRHVEQSTAVDRLLSTLSAAFAVLTTLIAGVGLYGVLAYTVAQRTREIGLRMAIGAQRWQIQAMVLRQVGMMTLAGVAIGIAAASALGRLVQSLLFELRGNDPAITIAAVLSLASVVFLAGFVPAYRASRVHPMEALRYE